MSLAVTICATKNFTYAMCEQLRRIVANLRDEPPGHVILSGDSSPELKGVIAECQRLMPDSWRVHHIENRLAEDNNPRYQQVGGYFNRADRDHSTVGDVEAEALKDIAQLLV